jgi:hypothetical protein
LGTASEAVLNQAGVAAEAPPAAVFDPLSRPGGGAAGRSRTPRRPRPRAASRPRSLVGEIAAYDGDDPTCTPKRYRAGEGFVDPGDGHVHLLRNETDAPAETVAVQFLPKNATRRIDAPAPGNCSF